MAATLLCTSTKCRNAFWCLRTYRRDHRQGRQYRQCGNDTAASALFYSNPRAVSLAVGQRCYGLEKNVLLESNRLFERKMAFFEATRTASGFYGFGKIAKKKPKRSGKRLGRDDSRIELSRGDASITTFFTNLLSPTKLL